MIWMRCRAPYKSWCPASAGCSNGPSLEVDVITPTCGSLGARQRRCTTVVSRRCAGVVNLFHLNCVPVITAISSLFNPKQHSFVISKASGGRMLSKKASGLKSRHQSPGAVQVAVCQATRLPASGCSNAPLPA